MSTADLATGKSAPRLPASNCQLTHESITTQKCTPTSDEVCVPVTYPNQKVVYTKKCQEVTSVHCPTTPGRVLSKREAQHPALFYNPWQIRPLYVYPTYHPATTGYKPANLFVSKPPTVTVPEAVPVDTPTQAVEQEEEEDNGCHEVTSEHCWDQPVVASEPLVVNKCHSVTRVTCVPEVKKVPKTLCTPIVQQQSSKPSAESTADQQPLINPFAYPLFSS